MRTVLGPLTRLLGRPLAFLLRVILRLSARRAGLALVYHRIGDPPGDPDRELVPARGTAQFESELRHLKKRYRVVPASRLLEAAAARRRGERFPVSITFDDDLCLSRGGRDADPRAAWAAGDVLRRRRVPERAVHVLVGVAAGCVRQRQVERGLSCGRAGD